LTFGQREETQQFHFFIFHPKLFSRNFLHGILP
jgi:hypothetical protein